MLSQRSIGAAGGGVELPSDDEFNRVSFLSHFDGSNNGVNNVFDDSSSSNHTITANGNVTQGSFGPFARPDGEWGVSFDGSGDRVRANWAENVGTSDFTIEAWVFIPSDMDQYDCIAWLQEANHSSAGDNGFFIRANNSNTIEFAVLSGGTVYNAVSSAISFNEWHHLSISKSGTTMYYSVDGTVANRSAPSGINNSKYLNIGAADANGSVSYPFNGLISNVRFLIGTALYTSSFTVPTSPLTAITNTKFLGCQSNRFVDNSSNGYTVSTSGDAAVSAFGPFLTSSVYDAGVNGASAYFDGTNDYLTTPANSLDLSNDDFTIESWVFTTSTGKQNIIGATKNQDGTGSYMININRDSNQVRFFCRYNGGTVLDYNVGTGSFPLNAWTHLAVTRDGANLRVFIDGTQVGTTNTTLGSFAIDNASLNGNIYYIGTTTDGASDFQGNLSSLRVVIGTAVYTSNFTPPTAPLTAVTNTNLLLNMADGQAIDSAAQNNMTLYGDAKISNTQSKFGGTSMYFDGTGDYATFPNTPFGTGDFTVECWVRCLGTTYDKGIWDNHTSSASSDGLTLTRISEQEFRLFGTSELIRSGNFTITNTWVYVATVRSSGTLNLFVNGVSQGTTSFTTNLNSAADFVIGGGRYGGGPETGSINAYIDDFRISHTARYTSNFTAPTEPFADKGQ